MTRVALVLLAAVLAGCAGLTGQTRVPASTAGLAALSAWTATGRLAVAAGSEGGSGGFVWQQRGPETRLAVRGPLGAGAFEVTSDGEALEVTDASGKRLGPEAREALRARLGADLPLSSLRYWMIGLPDPASTAQVTESPESPGTPLRVIDQHGWTIAYDAFASTDGLALPSRVTATSGDVRLRLTVTDWRLDNGSQPVSEAAAPDPVPE